MDSNQLLSRRIKAMTSGHKRSFKCLNQNNAFATYMQAQRRFKPSFDFQGFKKTNKFLTGKPKSSRRKMRTKSRDNSNAAVSSQKSFRGTYKNPTLNNDNTVDSFDIADPAVSHTFSNNPSLSKRPSTKKTSRIRLSTTNFKIDAEARNRLLSTRLLKKNSSRGKKQRMIQQQSDLLSGEAFSLKLQYQSVREENTRLRSQLKARDRKLADANEKIQELAMKYSVDRNPRHRSPGAKADQTRGTVAALQKKVAELESKVAQLEQTLKTKDNETKVKASCVLSAHQSTKASHNLTSKALHEETKLTKPRARDFVLVNSCEQCTVNAIRAVHQSFSEQIITALKKLPSEVSSSEVSPIFEQFLSKSKVLSLLSSKKGSLISQHLLDTQGKPASKATVIANYNNTVKQVKGYTSSDFKQVIHEIEQYDAKEHKSELLNILQIFASKSGVAPDLLLSTISGCRINVDKQCLVAYFMNKSGSVEVINPRVLEEFCTNKAINTPKANKFQKPRTSLKVGQIDLIQDQDDAGVDKNSLKYKLRKAIITYFNKRLSERIQKFSRGQTMFEDSSGEGTLTSEEIMRKFFFNLAELLREKKTPLISIIKKHVFDSIYFQKEVQLIYVDDFFKSLRDFGMSYTQRQKDEVTSNMNIQDLSGKFLLEVIDNILNNLGVKKGLPVSTKAMNYESLDLKSIRIINRILKYISSEISSKHNGMMDKPRNSIGSDEVAAFLYQQLKPLIKQVEVIDANGNPTDIEYVESGDLAKLLREQYVYLEKKDLRTAKMVKFKSRIITEMELHGSLQLLVCISPNSALEKVMVKKLMALITQAWHNPYILAIGAIRRPDPKDEQEDEVAQVIDEKCKPRDLSDNEEEDFEEFDLSDIDERDDKKKERDRKMWEKRKNRKSTKKLNF
ncbi:unnamed protein product [Moneuplotes crassus]|uniref:Uncharacterized protein n=1 Tax=Euplotes crassus TaxID=5936 RepID=A0AAD2D1D9_EUPCR|nr:unnamed protein product [Moneuplotes crassus]